MSSSLTVIHGIYDDVTKELVDIDSGEVFEKCYHKYPVCSIGYFQVKFLPKFSLIIHSVDSGESISFLTEGDNLTNTNY